MFHKKILFTVFFILAFGQAFAASRNITSLKLDFLRTEEILTDNQPEQTSQSSTMTGTVIYNKNPFVFIFQIKTPAVQTMYVNAQGAYLFDNDTIYEITDNKDFLEQTCQDFLNWFKEDYGLSDSYFKPIDRWLEEGQIVSEWSCFNFEDQPLNKVVVYSDGDGRFTKLKMYANEAELITETGLDSFKSSQGYFYPTSIISVSYDEAKPFLKTTLKFSDVQFVLAQDEVNKLNAFADQTKLFISELPESDLSKAYEMKIPLTPAQASYKVSIPSVLVGTSFNFYKKFITSQDMSNCPFYPSCSQYMLDAVSANGVLGFFQGLERLRRCTSTEHKRDQYPTLSNGKHYDPVPVKSK